MSGLVSDIMWIDGRRWSNKLQQWLDPPPGGASSPAPAIGYSGPAMPQAGPSGALSGFVPAWVDRRILADVQQEPPDADDVTTGTARARVIVPSAKLIVAMTLGFEPETPGPITSYTSAAWSATLVRPAPPGGRECDLHALWSSETLPQGRVVAALQGEIAIAAALSIPTASGTALKGQWVLEVAIEAGMPMCSEEWTALSAKLALRPVRQLTFDIAEA